MAKNPIYVANARRGSHLIWTGYGHWLPNDPRGSGSELVRSEALEMLGEIHHERMAPQPPRAEVQAFYRSAEPKLLHSVAWFDEADRLRIGEAVRHVVREAGYTFWALAVMRNHVHAVVRTHQDRVEQILRRVATAMREAVWSSGKVPCSHPVWSGRMYKVYLTSDDAVRRTIRYVEQNPMKEKLPVQQWSFVETFAR